MKKIFIHLLLIAFFLPGYFNLNAQTNYFVDGYHGGVYGHYPMWVTRFIADTLQHYKDWKVNLEIEPETWDTAALKDPSSYEAFKKLINDSSQDVAIEYVNPAYAQGYLYNISGESIIRQFQYGMKKLQQHFPAIKFTTYSSEEPCFTSALPQILKSLGFKYAVLKNPNTCWGGYVKAYGGESVNWIGPDGSSILTVPRYASEALQKRSTWQTTAWNSSANYINAAINQGIQLPVGMCLQDAGWKNGPWLDNHKLPTTQYTTWRNYFKLIENNKNTERWKLSQEDIEVSLVWGSQILQRIAQQVRVAENKITMAEKAAALAKLYANTAYPEDKFDAAWRTLLLAEHHDCWIVPYNNHDGKTWAGHVQLWTANTDSVSDEIMQQSLQAISTATNNHTQNILAFNPTAISRKEIISVELDAKLPGKNVQQNGKVLPSQIVINKDSSKTLLFEASIAALGFDNFNLINQAKQSFQNKAIIKNDNDGNFIMETDLYKLVIDAQFGNIKQLISKKLNKDFVAASANNFNALQGHFYNDGGFAKSIDQPTKITVLENGPLRIKIQVEGKISENSFVQTIQLTQGEKLIDCNLHIDYKKGIGIGEDYRQEAGYYSTEQHKAFYNDSCKLLATFPVNFSNQRIYKDAPLDVTESKLSNTFYNSWDSIKNNIVDNWVDVIDSVNNYGMALFTDHVTSYSHGENFPLSLTVQYAGIGLWGRNYAVDGPTDIHYALLPHKGKWNEAGINNENIKWNEPIITSMLDVKQPVTSFVQSIDSGMAITTMYYKGDDLYIRLLNNGSKKLNHHIALNCSADSAAFIELNDTVTSSIKMQPGHNVSFDCKIPLFGFKTLKLTGAKAAIANHQVK